MNKIAIIILLALTLSACGGRTRTENVVIHTNIYPDLPDITKPIRMNLEGAEYEFPRDMSAAPVLKNLSTCRGVPEAEQDDDFLIKCYEQPVDSKSNVYIGWSQGEWNIYLKDMGVIKEQMRAYDATIDLVNEQREEWRRLNEAEDLNNNQEEE